MDLHGTLCSESNLSIPLRVYLTNTTNRMKWMEFGHTAILNWWMLISSTGIVIPIPFRSQTVLTLLAQMGPELGSTRRTLF